MSTHEDKDAALGSLAKRLEELINQRLQPEPQKGKWKRLLEWLNTPFALTLLTGLLGTGITLLWNSAQQRNTQHLANQKAEQEALQRQFERRYDALYGLMMKFINEFPSALARAYHAQLAYCILMSYEQQPPGPDGSKPRYADLRADFSKAEREAYAPPVLSSFTPQITATFRTIRVKEITAKLQARIAALQKPVSVEAANAVVDDINNIYDELVAAMSAELDQHTRAEAKLTAQPKD